MQFAMASLNDHGFFVFSIHKFQFVNCRCIYTACDCKAFFIWFMRRNTLFCLSDVGVLVGKPFQDNPLSLVLFIWSSFKSFCCINLWNSVWKVSAVALTAPVLSPCIAVLWILCSCLNLVSRATETLHTASSSKPHNFFFTSVVTD